MNTSESNPSTPATQVPSVRKVIAMKRHERRVTRDGNNLCPAVVMPRKPEAKPKPKLILPPEPTGGPINLRGSTTVISVLRKEFLDICYGDVMAALFLSNACHWDFWKRKLYAEDPEDPNGDADGWFYQAADKWEQEIGATRKMQFRARKVLRKAGLLRERVAGQPMNGKPTIYYQVDWKRLHDLLSNVTKGQIGEPCSLPKEHTPVRPLGTLQCDKRSNLLKEAEELHRNYIGREPSEPAPTPDRALLRPNQADRTVELPAAGAHRASKTFPSPKGLRSVLKTKAKLAANRKLGDDEIENWERMLDGVPLERVERAFDACLKKKSFFPTPAEVNAELSAAETPKPNSYAWVSAADENRRLEEEDAQRRRRSIQ